MAKDMKDIITRSGDQLIADMIGVIALFSLLIAGLHLPALI